MRHTTTPLFALLAVLLSTAAMSQTVTLNQNYPIPTPETIAFHGPVLTKDNYGNLYQAATVHQGRGDGDFIIVKYDRTGAFQWIVFWSSPGFEDDEVAAISTDRLGNVIVTGTTAFGGPFTETDVVKYDPNGVLLWADQGGQSVPTCITTDNADNILIGGTIPNAAGDSDFLVMKLDSTGAQLWMATYNGIAGRTDKVTAIATDASGDVYITGESMGVTKLRLPSGATATFPAGFDYETIKYNSNGMALWANRYASLGADIPAAMTLDVAANVYVTGSSNGKGTTVCYNTIGVQLWALRSDTVQNYTSIALDPSGNVVTAGYYINSAGLYYVLTKSTGAGSLTWSVTVGNGAGQYVPLNYGPYLALAIDRQSNIYISGEAITSGIAGAQNLDIWTLKYIPSGYAAWSQIFNSYPGSVPSSIAIIEPSSPGPLVYPTVCVGGFSNLNGQNEALLLLPYSQTVTIFRGFASSNTETGETKALDDNTRVASLSNYPNPFRGTTNIAYTLPNDGHVFLQIFDITGRTIATLVDEDETAGPHTIPYSSGRLAAGIYEYRIVATSPLGNFTSTKKMIVQ